MFSKCDLSQQSNISPWRENDVSHVSIIYSRAFGKHSIYTHTHTRTGLFFLLLYPCNHIVRKMSTLTQQPIIVFQETQNETEEKTEKGQWLISEAKPLTNNITQVESHSGKIRINLTQQFILN